MKTKNLALTLIMLVSLTLSAYSQLTSVPNGGFENWKMDTLYEDLRNFNSSNPSAYAVFSGANVLKVNGLNGFAAHIKTIVDGGDQFPGFIANGTIIDSDENTVYFTGGQAYTGMPDSIALDTKFNLAGDDSALVFVIFKKGGNVIYDNHFRIGGTRTSFNKSSFKLKNMLIAPDTMFIAIVSSDVLNEIFEEGSEIFVDNFRFIGGGGAPVLNGTMDDWDLKKLEEPDDWATLNFYESFGSITTATKTSDRKNGNLALRLESFAFDNGGGVFSQFGIISSGKTFFQDDGLGFPYSGNPSKFTFDLKYQPVLTKDTASLYCLFSKFNSDLGYSEQVGGAFVNVTGAVATYQHYEIPITMEGTPDTANIFIIAGSQSLPKSGSVLFVDNLGFDNKVLGVDEKLSLENGKLQYLQNNNFALNSNLAVSSDAQVRIMDLSGRLLYENNFSNVPSGPNIIVFSVPELATGIYVYSISTPTGLIGNKVFVN